MGTHTIFPPTPTPCQPVCRTDEPVPRLRGDRQGRMDRDRLLRSPAYARPWGLDAQAPEEASSRFCASLITSAEARRQFSAVRPA